MNEATTHVSVRLDSCNSCNLALVAALQAPTEWTKKRHYFSWRSTDLYADVFHGFDFSCDICVQNDLQDQRPHLYQSRNAPHLSLLHSASKKRKWEYFREACWLKKNKSTYLSSLFSASSIDPKYLTGGGSRPGPAPPGTFVSYQFQLLHWYEVGYLETISSFARGLRDYLFLEFWSRTNRIAHPKKGKDEIHQNM